MGYCWLLSIYLFSLPFYRRDHLSISELGQHTGQILLLEQSLHVRSNSFQSLLNSPVILKSPKRKRVPDIHCHGVLNKLSGLPRRLVKMLHVLNHIFKQSLKLRGIHKSLMVHGKCKIDHKKPILAKPWCQ